MWLGKQKGFDINSCLDISVRSKVLKVDLTEVLYGLLLVTRVLAGNSMGSRVLWCVVVPGDPAGEAPVGEGGQHTALPYVGVLELRAGF